MEKLSLHIIQEIENHDQLVANLFAAGNRAFPLDSDDSDGMSAFKYATEFLVRFESRHRFQGQGTWVTDSYAYVVSKTCLGEVKRRVVRWGKSASTQKSVAITPQQIILNQPPVQIDNFNNEFFISV